MEFDTENRECFAQAMSELTVELPHLSVAERKKVEQILRTTHSILIRMEEPISNDLVDCLAL